METFNSEWKSLRFRAERVLTRGRKYLTRQSICLDKVGKTKKKKRKSQLKDSSMLAGEVLGEINDLISREEK